MFVEDTKEYVNENENGQERSNFIAASVTVGLHILLFMTSLFYIVAVQGSVHLLNVTLLISLIVVLCYELFQDPSHNFRILATIAIFSYSAFLLFFWFDGIHYTDRKPTRPDPEPEDQDGLQELEEYETLIYRQNLIYLFVLMMVGVLTGLRIVMFTNDK